MRSGSARCSSASGTHSSGASEKPGLTKRRCKKKECHSPLGNVRIVTGFSFSNLKTVTKMCNLTIQ